MAVTVRSYVQTGHLNHEMKDVATGMMVAHRYQHVVTGIHYVRDYGPAVESFAPPVYSGPSEQEANKAWITLYRRYN